MSRLGKQIEFIPAGREKPQVGTIVYVHPQNRFLQVEYRVQASFGVTSPPMRECLQIVQGQVWTGVEDRPKRGRRAK